MSVEGERGTCLVIGEDAEGVQLDVWGQARAVAVLAAYDARHKGAVPQPILQCGLVRPVCAFPARMHTHMPMLSSHTCAKQYPQKWMLIVHEAHAVLSQRHAHLQRLSSSI